MSATFGWHIPFPVLPKAPFHLNDGSPGSVSGSIDRRIQIRIRVLDHKTSSRAQTYLNAARFVHAAARSVQIVQAHNGIVNA